MILLINKIELLIAFHFYNFDIQVSFFVCKFDFLNWLNCEWVFLIIIILTSPWNRTNSSIITLILSFSWLSFVSSLFYCSICKSSFLSTHASFRVCFKITYIFIIWVNFLKPSLNHISIVVLASFRALSFWNYQRVLR